MTQKSTVIWDLSGTLFRPNAQDMSLEEQEDYSFVFLMWSGKKEPSRLDTLAFKVLGLLGQQPQDDQDLVRVHTGEPLPEILVSYLAGRINSQEALDRTITFLKTWAPHHISQEDQKRLTRMFEIFFNPRSLVSCMKPIEPAVELLVKTAKKADQLYILSNWDHDSFIPFYQKYQDSILAPFERKNIVISADTGYVKPQRGIYEWLVSHTGLSKADSLFIDDQKENVEASKTFGIDALQCKLDEIGPLEIKLKELGLI